MKRSFQKIMGPAALFLLGAGIWWALSDRSPQAGIATPVGEGMPPSAARNSRPPADAITDDPQPERNKPPRDTTQAQEAVSTRNDRARSFVARENPDPAVSSELELAIQRALDESLDRSRFNVESVTCRANLCQIVSIDRAASPAIDGRRPDLQGWGPSLAKLFLQLKGTAVPGPRTGSTVGNPKLSEIAIVRDGGTVTMIRFEEAN